MKRVISNGIFLILICGIALGAIFGIIQYFSSKAILSSGLENFNIGSFKAQAEEQEVSFSRNQEEFISDFQLTITTTVADAKVFYTLNNTIPAINNGTEYTGPVTINKTTVVRAVACVTNEIDEVTSQSEEYSKVYIQYLNGVAQDIEDAWEISGQDIISYNGVFKDIIIPETIKNIGPNAFLESAVEAVTLHNSIEVIGDNAFAPSVTIRGYSESLAQEFAVENGNTFIAIDIDLEFVKDLPSEITIIDGIPSIFVVVSGFGLEYQWYENTELKYAESNALKGETSDTLKLSSSNEDRYFYVVVTDWLGNEITSDIQAILAGSIKIHTITLSTGQNGNIPLLNKSFEIADGEDFTFTFTADENYEAVVLVDGTEVNVQGTSYTLENVTAGHAVTVMFRMRTFVITYNELEGVDNNDNPGTYEYGSGFSLKVPGERKGYAFMGWYDAKENGNLVTEISDNKIGDIELWARWQKTGGMSTQTILLIVVGVVVVAALGWSAYSKRKQRGV